MPMNRAVALEKIDDLKQQLIEKYKPEKIILFGLSAWGDEDINDIDLFIVKEMSLTTGRTG